jgi:poly-gamma-glutamate synthesis protein (capsule biosynthesis protein)
MSRGPAFLLCVASRDLPVTVSNTEEKSPDSGVVRVTFLGDTLVGGEAQAVLSERGTGWAFSGIQPLLSTSDLVVANHEGPITERDAPQQKLDTGRKRYWYRARSDAVGALVDAGVRVVSLGNNHVLDYGEDALADTIEALDAAGIAHCGAGPNRAAARRPAIVTLGSLRIGFLSFMQRYDIYVAERGYANRARPGPMRLVSDRSRRDLGRLAERVDLPVALVHWGRNYRRRNGRQRRLAQHLVDSGARLVIGHHPHVAQPIEFVDDALVCFSLGNGPLGTPGRFHSGRMPYGLVVSVDLDRSARVRQLAVTPIFVDNSSVMFRPEIATDDVARRFVRKLLPAEAEWKESTTGTFEAVLGCSGQRSVTPGTPRTAP